MASHVFVLDTSARRHQIKTTPSKYLRDVLEEACQKFNKDPEQFILTDSGRQPKTLDLSLTVRLAGLVNGAKLQLVQSSRSPSVITVALQLPSGFGVDRLTDRIPSNTPLWQVLRKFEDGQVGDPPKKLNITQRGIASTSTGAGRLEYEQPVLNVMSRELASIGDLQKSLFHLGYNSGSVLLRLSYRHSGTPMEEAMQQISQYFSALGSSNSPAMQPSSSAVEANGERGVHAAAAGDAESKAEMDLPDQAMSSQGQTLQEPSEDNAVMPPPQSESQRPFEEPGLIASSTETDTSRHENASQPNIAVYKPSSNAVPQAALQPHNPADFEPLVEHAQAHQATLLRASQNRRLQSDAEIAAADVDRQQRLSGIKSATLRVRFPDQMMIDTVVTADDTTAILYTKVREMLDRPSEPFLLRYTGSKGSLATLDASGPAGEKRLIRDLGMNGRVLVTMVWDQSASLEARQGVVLKESVRSLATELQVKMPDEGAGASSSPGASGKGVEGAKVEKKERSKGDVEAKMKKFLGFGKK